MDAITVTEHGPTIDRSDKTQPTLVLLHGYGSNERDLTGLVPMVGPDLPWVSLRGPVELGGDAAAWFRVTPQGPLPGAVEDATTTLWNWIDGNLPDRPIVPIGFSQGGAMALQLVRTRPDRIAAAAVLSGFLHAAPDERPDPARYRPPVFWGRGDVDPLVDPARVKLTNHGCSRTPRPRRTCIRASATPSPATRYATSHHSLVGSPGPLGFVHEVLTFPRHAKWAAGARRLGRDSGPRLNTTCPSRYIGNVAC